VTRAEYDAVRGASTRALLRVRRIRRAYRAWLAGARFRWFAAPAAWASAPFMTRLALREREFAVARAKADEAVGEWIAAHGA
jgi:hypothetical protein